MKYWVKLCVLCSLYFTVFIWFAEQFTLNETEWQWKIVLLAALESSVHRGQVYTPRQTGRQADTPLGRHPPGQTPLLGRHPPGRHPQADTPRQTPPRLPQFLLIEFCLFCCCFFGYLSSFCSAPPLFPSIFPRACTPLLTGIQAPKVETFHELTVKSNTRLRSSLTIIKILKPLYSFCIRF